MNRKLKATLITASVCGATVLVVLGIIWGISHPAILGATSIAMFVAWLWTMIYIGLD